MSDLHRKIELQSMEDLQYLVANARRAAQEHLDQLFPPSSNPDLKDEDPMRGPIERNVQEYLNEVFTTAAPNITINGLDVTPEMLQSVLNSRSAGTEEKEIEEHEPFDSRLHERAKALAQEEADLIEEIARLKRTVPSSLVENAKKGFGGVEDDERVLATVEGRAMERAGNERGIGEGVGRMERQHEMEATWKRAVRGAKGFEYTLPELVAKKERAETVEGYVLKEGRL